MHVVKPKLKPSRLKTTNTNENLESLADEVAESVPWPFKFRMANAYFLQEKLALQILDDLCLFSTQKNQQCFEELTALFVLGSQPC